MEGIKALSAVIVSGIVLCLVPIARASPVAQIDNSLIIGQRVKFLGHELNQFLGVPYALPPVGPLRFQKPQPIQNYNKLFLAVKNPPSCLQYSKSPYPWYIDTEETSEDCLYMNIWAPADASHSNPKAVLLFIYGGVFLYGGVNDPLYNGAALAALGDIVIVTMNYRLSFFGFLTSNSTYAPGNLGVWDVLECLRWVNKNIGAFGGDVNRITIGGESAGALSSALMSITPLAKGLYHRLIMESGSVTHKRADNNTQNLAYSQKLATYLGCGNDSYTIDKHPKEVVQCLQGIDAHKINLATWELAPNASTVLIPEFGNEMLSENPRISIAKGDFRCTDLLIGVNEDEGSFETTFYLNQSLFGFFGEKNPHIERPLAEKYLRLLTSDFEDPEPTVQYYLPPHLTEDTNYQIRRQLYTAAGDTSLLCPTVYYAEKCAEQKKKVYFYLFNHRPSVSPYAPWMGTTHFEEVQFVFGQPIMHPNKYTSAEVVLSREMVDIWSSFVKYGKPDIPWPLYSRETPAFKYLGLNKSAGSNGYGPHASNCDFLRPYYGFS